MRRSEALTEIQSTERTRRAAAALALSKYANKGDLEATKALELAMTGDEVVYDLVGTVMTDFRVHLQNFTEFLHFAAQSECGCREQAIGFGEMFLKYCFERFLPFAANEEFSSTQTTSQVHTLNLVQSILSQAMTSALRLSTRKASEVPEVRAAASKLLGEIWSAVNHTRAAKDALQDLAANDSTVYVRNIAREQLSR